MTWYFKWITLGITEDKGGSREISDEDTAMVHSRMVGLGGGRWW